jgi:gliding motility-associated-like protein
MGLLFSLFGVMFSASSSGRSLNNIGTAFRWDGLINNIPASVDSYWYLVKLNDIETLRGNFTLMR